MAGLLQVHKVVVNSVVGEDEIIEKNILNVLVKGLIFPPSFLLNYINFLRPQQGGDSGESIGLL